MKNLLLDLLFPRKCILCETKSHDDLELCCACRAELPIIKNNGKYCIKCGAILDITITNSMQLCGTCIKNPPPFDRTIAIFHYQKPIDYLILKLKFNNNLSCAALLGDLMAKHLLAHYSQQKLPQPEVIIPIPLHSQRLKERGFNQAVELARPIAKALHIPIDKYSFIRTKNTEAQSLLKTKERQQNVTQAFAIKKATDYRCVAVIDDVITTGNTAREFCNILRKTGIIKIDLWSAARARTH
jgi:ComF family protein